MSKLMKSKDKMLSGVCGGIAKYMDVDPTIVRTVYAGVTLFSAFPGVILYIMLAIIMPSD